MLALCFVALSVGLAGAEHTDEEVRHLILRSGWYIDDGDLARADFRLAKEWCGTDTNRFARLLYELAQTNDVKIADRMIRCLGRNGTVAQLPFLYSQATNVAHGVSAVRSILRLEGVTSNSVAAAERYLTDGRFGDRNCYEVCDALLNQSKRIPLPAAAWSNAMSVARQFMAARNIYHDWLDQAMIRADPSYLASRRRLAVMRSVMARTQEPGDLAYVTNAINELVAYPEENLSE